MREKRLALNTISSLILQLTTIICGFILPKLILEKFGSDVNGLVNSINQFLQIFAFMDIGVGAVFQSSLYKPLAENDNEELSKIFTSGQKFFTLLAKMLLIYVCILILIYPLVINKNFKFSYTTLLIISMSISSFAQYYLGMSNALFLAADQRGYIYYSIQIVTLILNTVCCYILINLGSSIQLVKLVTSLIYLLRPLVLKFYVDKNYKINKKIEYVGEPIKQKWDGLAQHVASVVLDSTDTIVLTVFSTLSNVSIYSVYFLVISGLKQIFNVTSNGIQSLIGEVYAKSDINYLKKIFGLTEWTIHTSAVIIFGASSILIVPFVDVYTKGVLDANYSQPIFAFILVAAYAIYCIRLPYHITVKAGVHYRQTKMCYWNAAILNIIVSIIFVNKLGLIGVAIGTLVAMLYQTIWLAKYISKHIIIRSFNKFLKQMFVDIIIVFFGFLLTKKYLIMEYSYLSWCINAIKVVSFWIIISTIINVSFYNQNIRSLYIIYLRVRGKN